MAYTSKTIVDYYYNLKLSEKEARALLSILELVESNSKKYTSHTGADDIEGIVKSMKLIGIEVGVADNKPKCTTDGHIVFSEF